MKPIIIVNPGDVYRWFTVIREESYRLKGHRAFLCECRCGTEKVITLGNLRAGSIKSCGCYKEKLINDNKLKPNDVYNWWTVIREYTEKTNTNRGICFLCQCKCGTQKVIPGSSLKNGRSKSCGYYRSVACISRATKHGGRKTKEYSTWVTMRASCNNRGHQGYYAIGFRDISYCKRWDKFENFIEDMGEKTNSTCLKRRDNEKDFFKENCYWGTR